MNTFNKIQTAAAAAFLLLASNASFADNSVTVDVMPNASEVGLSVNVINGLNVDLRAVITDNLDVAPLVGVSFQGKAVLTQTTDIVWGFRAAVTRYMDVNLTNVTIAPMIGLKLSNVITVGVEYRTDIVDNTTTSGTSFVTRIDF